MTHTQVSLRLLIGVAVVGGVVVLSGLVWLARQQSRRARIRILTQGGAPRPGLRTPTDLRRSKAPGACSVPLPIPSPLPPRYG